MTPIQQLVADAKAFYASSSVRPRRGAFISHDYKSCCPLAAAYLFRHPETPISPKAIEGITLDLANEAGLTAEEFAQFWRGVDNLTRPETTADPTCEAWQAGNALARELNLL